MPVLAKAVRDVELAVERGRPRASTRSTFQAVALLVREERTRLQAQNMPEGRRNEQLKRLDGIATALARTAARDGTLLTLLTEDAQVLPDTKALLREMRLAGGLELPSEAVPDIAAAAAPAKVEKQVVPRSVISRQLANPFLEPDFSAPPPPPRPRLLATWELLGPLLRAFERASGGARSCMALPEPSSLRTSTGRELMPHQAQVVAAAADGHRTFLLADEPGLGKTAQALLAAQAADAYPLLAVVPNVVKTNWAREAKLWTPERSVTVVHGDGENIDAFSDIVVVNYEVLDRHVGWFGTFGFRGMVVDEAHFIKNKSSQRSQHVLELSERIRWRTTRPLLMALTGTPLINDIDDFLAIWQFLGWIDEDEPSLELMSALECNGFTPMDPDFYPAARAAVIDLGIVRRRKVDVAADIPARRIADLPVELDGAAGRSIREAERVLARRLVKRYRSALEARDADVVHTGIDHDLVRRVAGWERQEAKETQDAENVFSMMRRIGQAKAVPAADYAAQLARSAGKVVLFAKHVDVM
nr:SNF2-related protein [Actinomycetota bacterium]